MSRAVYIVSAVRTAVGKANKGALRSYRPEDLLANPIKEALRRIEDKFPKEDVDDVIAGCAFPEGTQGMNIARIAVYLAGLPYTVTAMTINRFCSSGLQAIALGAQGIAAGYHEVVVAGGVESMSTVPMGGYNLLPHPGLMAEYPEAYTSMGITAEIVAEKYGITRERQDQFGLASNQKAVAAIQAGRFKEQIVPLQVYDYEKGEMFTFDTDEGPRADTTLEGLAKLKPAFKTNGTVTAGTSSQVSDGGAALVLMSEDAVKKYGLQPLARFVNFQVAGVPPEVMGIGPAEAIPKLLKKTGIAEKEISWYELNEAFAAQSLACLDLLAKSHDLDPAKVNPNGGAIALGHPLGCTGAKLAVQMVYQLRDTGARYGIVSMCIGGGMGGAGLIERV
ncbi:thiolase family protein [Myxococcota bacterium]|jgi:acetyl-CoA acyltransferase|nr:thiolase family protein [Myxococcota bacterium]